MGPLDVEDDLAETPSRPRFPALRVAACAAGLLAAAYLWLGWGYCWNVTADELVSGKPPLGFCTWEERYVRLRGRPESINCNSTAAVVVRGATTSVIARTDVTSVLVPIMNHDRNESFLPIRREFKGRVARRAECHPDCFVDTLSPRISGITALAFVLAFWSVVFGRMWIREWRSEKRSESPHRG